MRRAATPFASRRRPRRRTNRGFAVADALVAAALAGLALAGLVASTTLAARQLRDVRRASLVASLAVDALERLRPGPYRAGNDRFVGDGLVFERAWEATDGRGRPTRLRAAVTSSARRETLATAVAP
jgi:hypothetical protein